MGYCILFVHGLKKLSTWLNKWRITVLTLFTLLLLLFSWKTVKQNEIWLSRESLFRYEQPCENTCIFVSNKSYVFVAWSK